MNWRRVLFLLWIVGTVLFVLAVAFGRYSEIKTEFEALVTSLAQTIARNRIAADNNLTLACQGTSIFKMFAWKGPTQEGQPEPISIGIIVNLTKRTVTGLDEKPPLTEPPLEIRSINDTAITFGIYWSSKDGQTIKGASGKLDRLTGDMEVTRTYTQDAYLTTSAWNYSLKCRPTQRMF